MNAFTAEVVGTMLLILLGNGVVANVVLPKTKGHGGGWIVITTGWALAVFAGVVVAGPYSGAHINPAVTIGLAVAGKFPWAEVPLYILAQMIGAMIGAFLVWLIYKDHYDAATNANDNLATFCTGPGIRNTSINLAAEAIGTFVLVFVIFHFTDAKLGDGNTPVGLGSIGAIPVSLLVLAIGLSLGGPTGYAINPARDLGPRIVHALLPLVAKRDSNWGYAWIPVVGPLAGGVFGAIVYLWITT
jgi:glycerol uptake facilitator